MTEKFENKEENGKTLILFDVGGVLLELDYENFYKEWAKLSKRLTPEEFKKKYIESKLEANWLEWKISTKQYVDYLRDILSTIDIDDKVLEGLTRFKFKQSIDEIVKLKKDLYELWYSVGVFSNIDGIALKAIQKMNPEIFETYDEKSPKIYSHEVWSMKPKPEMYEQIKWYDKVVFIDDKESYLRTGIEQFDWKWILYTQFIDKAETIRVVPSHSDTTKPIKDFKVANTINDLKEALKGFGVKV